MNHIPINEALITTFQKISDPKELIAEVFKKFGNQAAIGTSGQLTGVVMIDMAIRAKVKPRVFTIDTLRLFPETYELFDALEKKYKIKIEKIQPNPKKLEQMVKQHGEFLFFDSKAKQEYCCKIRKVDPNEEALKTVDLWLTGLRKDQSEGRSQTEKFQMIKHSIDGHSILKISPLVDWTEKQLKDYCKKNSVPTHKLLELNQDGWYYESLGCVICTTPIGPNEPRRAGRWRWFNATDSSSYKECGIHVASSTEKKDNKSY